MPPIITVGLESEREHYIKTKGEKARDYVWMTGSLKNCTEISEELIGEAALNDFRAYNSYISANEKWSAIEKVLSGVSKRLLEYDWQDLIQITDDFVIFVQDESGEDSSISIKRLNKKDALKILQHKNLIY